MPNLSSSSRVYGIDYLGQGRSWPLNCNDGNGPTEVGLNYSIDTWADQIIQFIEEIILQRPNNNNNNGDDSSISKVHLVGNSVGGYLAVVLASKRPDLIASICLLNATPVRTIRTHATTSLSTTPMILFSCSPSFFVGIQPYRTIYPHIKTRFFRQKKHTIIIVTHKRYGG